MAGTVKYFFQGKSNYYHPINQRWRWLICPRIDASARLVLNIALGKHIQRIYAEHAGRYYL
jgi:hypothetical protein